MEIEALEQLPDEFLDELISADIDGELHAALQDLEIAATVDQTQLWFTTSSRAAARYATMQSAAQLFAAPFTETLDEVSKRRLVRATLGHTQVQKSRGLQRLSLAVAASAACVVLIIGIGVSLSRGPDADIADPKTTASSIPHVEGSPEMGVSATNAPAAIDLGTVANVQQLREKADGLQTTEAGGSTTVPNRAGRQTVDVAAQESSCTAVLPGIETASELAIAATATVGTQPVAIATGSDPQGRTLRWAYRISDCSILFSDRS